MKIRSEIDIFCDFNSGPIFLRILLHFGRVSGRVWPPLGAILDVLGPPGPPPGCLLGLLGES